MLLLWLLLVLLLLLVLPGALTVAGYCWICATWDGRPCLTTTCAP
jgi:hypothetical protein